MQGNLASIRFDGDTARVPPDEVGAYVTLLALAANEGIPTDPRGAGKEITVVFENAEAARLIQSRLAAMLPTAAM